MRKLDSSDEDIGEQRICNNCAAFARHVFALGSFVGCGYPRINMRMKSLQMFPGSVYVYFNW